MRNPSKRETTYDNAGYEKRLCRYSRRVSYIRKDASSENMHIDFSDIEFQIDLLKTNEINLDYILALILENSKEYQL